jgi:hypothetical protein
LIYDFQASLKKSKVMENAEWWEPVYRHAFPGFFSMMSVKEDGWAQRGGIDRVITLRSGKIITVDEKIRYAVYPDILLERWSNEEKRIPGWIQKNQACDYIAYAFALTGKCYLLPFLQLRKAWRTYGDEWIHKYKRIEAKNINYTTVSVGVPTDVLLKAMSDIVCVNWST